MKINRTPKIRFFQLLKIVFIFLVSDPPPPPTGGVEAYSSRHSVGDGARQGRGTGAGEGAQRSLTHAGTRGSVPRMSPNKNITYCRIFFRQLFCVIFLTCLLYGLHLKLKCLQNPKIPRSDRHGFFIMQLFSNLATFFKKSRRELYFDDFGK